jgi:hypothetical protein
MDLTCVECERLWQAYKQAYKQTARAQQLIEHRSVMEAGFDVTVRKAAHRCQQARSALLNHVAIHIPVTAAASASG